VEVCRDHILLPQHLLFVPVPLQPKQYLQLTSSTSNISLQVHFTFLLYCGAELTLVLIRDLLLYMRKLELGEQLLFTKIYTLLLDSSILLFLLEVKYTSMKEVF